MELSIDQEVNRVLRPGGAVEIIEDGASLQYFQRRKTIHGSFKTSYSPYSRDGLRRRYERDRGEHRQYISQVGHHAISPRRLACRKICTTTRCWSRCSGLYSSHVSLTSSRQVCSRLVSSIMSNLYFSCTPQLFYYLLQARRIRPCVALPNASAPPAPTSSATTAVFVCIRCPFHR